MDILPMIDVYMTARGQAKMLKDLTRPEALDVIEFMTAEIKGLRLDVARCRENHGPVKP